MPQTSYQKSRGASSTEQVNLMDPAQRRSRSRPRNTAPIVVVLLCLVVVMVGVGIMVVLSSAKRARIGEKQATLAHQQINILNEKKTHAVSGCESTIIALRHCEKIGAVNESHEDHCSYLGFERSVYLSTLFGDDKARWPMPSRLYAMNKERPDSKKKHDRQTETLTPLSQKGHVNIDTAFTMGQETDLADDIFKRLTSGELCGRVTVISWKHTEMAALAKALACGEDEGCPDWYPSTNFDQVWEIKYVYDPPVPVAPLEHKKGKPASLRSLKSSGKWAVFGYVTQQDFDPLHFSYEAGDYPTGGTESGGKWYEFLDKPSEKNIPHH